METAGILIALATFPVAYAAARIALAILMSVISPRH
jgi:hypothetical protein